MRRINLIFRWVLEGLQRRPFFIRVAGKVKLARIPLQGNSPTKNYPVNREAPKHQSLLQPSYPVPTSNYQRPLIPYAPHFKPKRIFFAPGTMPRQLFVQIPCVRKVMWFFSFLLRQIFPEKTHHAFASFANRCTVSIMDIYFTTVSQ